MSTHVRFFIYIYKKEVSEYDQDIPQSYTADQPTAPCGRVTEH